MGPPPIAVKIQMPSWFTDVCPMNATFVNQFVSFPNFPKYGPCAKSPPLNTSKAGS